MALNYLRLTARDLTGSPFHSILTEVNDAGEVLRELGMNESGEVVHAAPTVTDPYGLFDLQRVQHSGESDISAEEFESLWRIAAGAG